MGWGDRASGKESRRLPGEKGLCLEGSVQAREASAQQRTLAKMQKQGVGGVTCEDGSPSTGHLPCAQCGEGLGDKVVTMTHTCLCI